MPVYQQYYVTHNMATSQMTFELLYGVNKLNVLSVEDQIAYENGDLVVDPEQEFSTNNTVTNTTLEDMVYSNTTKGELLDFGMEARDTVEKQVNSKVDSRTAR